MRPTKLDHVALNVQDPEDVAARLLARLPFRILESTDEFVLVGRRPDLGKLTLLRAPHAPDRGVLVRIAIAVPCAVASSALDAGPDLAVELVPGARDGEVDLDHVVLHVPDPGASAQAWVELGFERADRVGGGERVRVGDAILELRHGVPTRTERSLLAHVGLLVDSADDAREDAERRGLEVRRFVEADNSRAVFLSGPDGVEVELIEHLPSFALV